MTFDAFDLGESLRVVGRLTDVRPWAAEGRAMVHDMELEVEVRRSDLVIVSAEARMHAFPHAECPQIEAAFGGLVGLSIGRGYTKAVSERFVGVLGCSHLEHLARSLGPAVIQAGASVFVRHVSEGGEHVQERQSSGRPSGAPWLRNTCHVWAEGGVGERKVALGAFPSDKSEYPVPSIEVLLKRKAGAS